MLRRLNKVSNILAVTSLVVNKCEQGYKPCLIYRSIVLTVLNKTICIVHVTKKREVKDELMPP